MPFRSPHFKFNGKSSRDFQLRICQIGNGKDDKTFGIERTANKESGIGMVSTLKGFSYQTPSIEITLIKTDGHRPLPFTKEERFEIIKWLFQDDFKPFISEDDESKVYYALFTKGSRYYNGLDQGYLNLTMELNAPCAFSPVLTNFFYVCESQLIEFENKTNVERFTYPDLEFCLNGETTDLTIENLTTGDVMSFANLKPETHLYCYNEDLKQLQCLNDPSYNARPCFNNQWLKLAQGHNLLRISAKDAHLKLISQAKLALD